MYPFKMEMVANEIDKWVYNILIRICFLQLQNHPTPSNLVGNCEDKSYNPQLLPWPITLTLDNNQGLFFLLQEDSYNWSMVFILHHIQPVII